MNNFDFLDNEDFLNALEKQKVKLFVKPGMPLVSWDEILQFVSDHKSERVGYKILPNDFAFFYNRAERIDKINIFVKEVHRRFRLNHTDKNTLTCQLFGTTIVEKGTSLEKHHDSENNLFWQCKGKSRWMLFDSYETDKPYMDIIVEEGDVLFIPSNTIHYVEPETPRACVAILFDTERI